MVERTKPHVVFLDFDRTLATARGGGSPLQGARSVDAVLAAMIASHSNVHIVTRNSNKDAIATFLKREQISVQRIHSVKQEGKSKSDVICAMPRFYRQANRASLSMMTLTSTQILG